MKVALCVSGLGAGRYEMFDDFDDKCISYFKLQGIGGSGRSSVARLAAFVSDYEVFQIEIAKNYGICEWTEDIKKVLRKAGYNGIPTVFLLGDHQIKVSLTMIPYTG